MSNRWADILAKAVTMKLVRRDYRFYFIVCFVLEYLFKEFIYTLKTKEQKDMAAKYLTMTGMGTFAVALSMRRHRAIKPLNALSGYNIYSIPDWVDRYNNGTITHFRSLDVNPLRWHACIYYKSFKKCLIPLTLAVAVPTFLFALFEEESMETYLTRSYTNLPQSFANLTPEKRRYNFKRALRKAVEKTFSYGMYVCPGLSFYPQILEAHYQVTGRIPNKLEIFVVGALAVRWLYWWIPEDKVFAYNHWALTTMIDALFQESNLQEQLQLLRAFNAVFGIPDKS